MGGVFVCVFIFFLTLLTYIFLARGKKEPQKRATLPPGSMGWPYVGETLQLYTQDPSVFFAAKQKRSLFFLFLFFFFLSFFSLFNYF
jgi:(+)-abscisic acid 8'-hydroxylase